MGHPEFTKSGAGVFLTVYVLAKAYIIAGGDPETARAIASFSSVQNLLLGILIVALPALAYLTSLLCDIWIATRKPISLTLWVVLVTSLGVTLLTAARFWAIVALSAFVVAAVVRAQVHLGPLYPFTTDKVEVTGAARFVSIAALVLLVLTAIPAVASLFDDAPWLQADVVCIDHVCPETSPNEESPQPRPTPGSKQLGEASDPNSGFVGSGGRAAEDPRPCSRAAAELPAVPAGMTREENLWVVGYVLGDRSGWTAVLVDSP